LVNQTLKQHIEWYSNVQKAGFISVRKALIQRLLQKHSDAQISEMAKEVAEVSTKDLILLLRNKFTIVSALDVLESWIKISGYVYSHNVSGSKHSLIIQHNMGQKWSVYLVELCKHVCQQFKFTDYSVDITENVILIEVDLSRQAGSLQ
jgi:hypothetical protein